MAANGERSSAGPNFGSIALFALSFTLATLGLRALLPHGGARELVDAKVERFAREADAYTLVFAGSSRVHRGFVPEVFDARTATIRKLTPVSMVTMVADIERRVRRRILELPTAFLLSSLISSASHA